jgi:hypothetical protein
VGFVVDEVDVGQVFSEYFSFPCQFSFYRLLHTQHISSGAGTIGLLVIDAPSGLSLTKKLKKKKKKLNYGPRGQVGPAVTLWTSVREVHVSNLGRHFGIPTETSRGFPQSIRVLARIASKLGYG